MWRWSLYASTTADLTQEKYRYFLLCHPIYHLHCVCDFSSYYGDVSLLPFSGLCLIQFNKNLFSFWWVGAWNFCANIFASRFFFLSRHQTSWLEHLTSTRDKLFLIMCCGGDEEFSHCELFALSDFSEFFFCLFNWQIPALKLSRSGCTQNHLISFNMRIFLSHTIFFMAKNFLALINSLG